MDHIAIASLNPAALKDNQVTELKKKSDRLRHILRQSQPLPPSIQNLMQKWVQLYDKGQTLYKNIPKPVAFAFQFSKLV